MASSFASVGEAYLADCQRRSLRPATLRYYGMVLACFAKTTGIEAVDEFTLARVRSFQDASARLSAGSLRGFIRALKTFGTWMADEGLLETDPLLRLRLPRADRRVISVPTDTDLGALLRASGPLLRTVVLLLAGAGLRIADLTALELDDLRCHELVVARTKNRVGRLVPLDPILAGILVLYVDTARADVGDSLFVSRTGRPLSADAVRHALTDTRTRAQCGVPVSPHVLRHWHARDLAASNVSERMLAARMGWSDHALVARYAPVGHAELVRDVARYAPAVRLRDAGILDGLFPSAVLRDGVAQRSKYSSEPARAAAVTSPRSRRS
jgi:integrase/recombinase XerD